MGQKLDYIDAHNKAEERVMASLKLLGAVTKLRRSLLSLRNCNKDTDIQAAEVSRILSFDVLSALNKKLNLCFFIETDEVMSR